MENQKEYKIKTIQKAEVSDVKILDDLAKTLNNGKGTVAEAFAVIIANHKKYVDSLENPVQNSGKIESLQIENDTKTAEISRLIAEIETINIFNTNLLNSVKTIRQDIETPAEAFNFITTELAAAEQKITELRTQNEVLTAQNNLKTELQDWQFICDLGEQTSIEVRKYRKFIKEKYQKFNLFEPVENETGEKFISRLTKFSVIRFINFFKTEYM